MRQAWASAIRADTVDAPRFKLHRLLLCRSAGDHYVPRQEHAPKRYLDLLCARKIEAMEEPGDAFKASNERILKLAVTGEESFALRHRFLFDAMNANYIDVQYATTRYRTRLQRTQLLACEANFIFKRLCTRRSHLPRCKNDVRLLRRAFIISPSSFEMKSRQTEQTLQRLSVKPDMVFHIFSLFKPTWSGSTMPYVHYLDFTTALGRRNWPANVPSPTDAEYNEWLQLERSTYQNAAHLFVMSKLVRRSLLEDYSVDAGRVTVVGSGGHYPEVFSGTKTFGSKRLLFNANPFGRKGGDVVLAAFERVRRTFPEATLVVVGAKLRRPIPGVLNPGFIADSEAMRTIFLSCDLVVAPSRADPFPGFVIEAMSHKVPCIVSPFDGMPEIVDDGINGSVLTRNEPVELADKVIELLGDRSRLDAFSLAAHIKAVRDFSWSAIGLRISNKLREIV